MAIPWLTVLKSVPWADVISNAPKVADGAKRLWSAVSRSPSVDDTSAESAAVLDDDAQGSAALFYAKLDEVERATADLQEQMLASSELIKTLADQNAQLIKGIEANRLRLAWLTGAVVLFGGVAVAALVFTLLR